MSAATILIEVDGHLVPLNPDNCPPLTPGFVERVERRHRLEELQRLHGRRSAGDAYVRGLTATTDADRAQAWADEHASPSRPVAS